MNKNKENKKAVSFKQDITAEETKKRSGGGEIFWKILSAVLSVAAIVISLLALLSQNRSQFYERVFQPLTYAYTPQVSAEEMRTFDTYTVPAVSCKATFHSGFPTQLTVINSDETLENMYTYSSKTGVEPLTDLSIEFPLQFKSLVFYDNMAYQYIFIYIEGSDDSWHLDCIRLSHDKTTGETDVAILEELDLLRLQFETDEAHLKVLEEYERVYQAITEIKAQK